MLAVMQIKVNRNGAGKGIWILTDIKVSCLPTVSTQDSSQSKVHDFKAWLAAKVPSLTKTNESGTNIVKENTYPEVTGGSRAFNYSAG